MAVKLEGVGKLAFKFYKSVLPLALVGSLLLPYDSLGKEKKENADSLPKDKKENNPYNYEITSSVVACAVNMYLAGISKGECETYNASDNVLKEYAVRLYPGNKVIEPNGKPISKKGWVFYLELYNASDNVLKEYAVRLYPGNKVIEPNGKPISEKGWIFYLELYNASDSVLKEYAVRFKPQKFSKDLFKDSQKYLATLGKDLQDYYFNKIIYPLVKKDKKSRKEFCDYAKYAWKSGAEKAWESGAEYAWKSGAEYAWKSGAEKAWESGAEYAWKSGAEYAWKSGAEKAWESGAEKAWESPAWKAWCD